MGFTRLAVLAWIAALGGCGDGSGMTPIGDGPDQSGVTPPMLPAEAAAPVLTPCRSGWRVVSNPAEPEDMLCEPWPETGHVDCTGAEAHFAGEAGCARIGPACPPGDWSDSLPAGATIVYVRAGAPAGGDGSLAAPFSTIGDATDVAPRGAVIALSKGIFEEAVVLPRGLTLWGACVAETILSSSSESETVAVVTAAAPEARVRAVTIRGDRPGIVAPVLGTTIDIEDVLVDGAFAMGLAAYDGGRLTARNVVVRNTRVRRSDGHAGWGVTAYGGGSIEASRVVSESNRDFAAVVGGAGSRLTLTDAVIRGTEPAADGTQGAGLVALDGALAFVTGAVIERNRLTGIVVSNGSHAEVADVVVRETTPDMAMTAGIGVYVDTGSSLVLRRAFVGRNQGRGVFALGTLEVEDVVVADQLSPGPAETLPFGFGIYADLGASVTGRRVLVSGTLGINVSVLGDAVVELQDVTSLDARFIDVGPELAGVTGFGVVVFGPATFRGTRVRLEGNAIHSAGSRNTGAMLELTDLVVRDNGIPGRSGGAAVILSDGGAARIERALLERNASLGLHLQAGGMGVVSDLTVRDMMSGGDLRLGLCVTVSDGSTLQASRVHLERCRLAAVAAFGSVARFDDLGVIDTLDEECAGTGGCPENGVGLGAYGSSSVEVTRFFVQQSAVCGIQVATDGAMDLHVGTVSHNPIGANVQVAGFDLARLSDRVAYSDNGTNLDSVGLPVPDATYDDLGVP